MGHRGKHIIDPETGLCVLCDTDAIKEIREGKTPEQRLYYTKNGNERSRPSRNDEDSYVGVH